MGTYTKQNWLKMYTPGEYQGQVVVYSYGVDRQEDVVVRRAEDRSDGSVEWAIADLDENASWTNGYVGGFVPPVQESDWERVEVVVDGD